MTQITDNRKTRTIGYMRISTVNESQKFDRQAEQLSGCDIVYKDRISGAKKDRPELSKLLKDLQAGDTVIIVSIDRLSRSTRDLLDIVESIKVKGANLKSLNDAWLDISGKDIMSDFLLTIMGALAEMERKQITQRVREGVAVAKKKGVQFGRPTANSTKVAHAMELYNAGNHTVKEITAVTGISKATLYRKLKE